MPVATAIQAVAGTHVDAQLEHSVTHWFTVAKIANGQAPQTNLNLRPGPQIAQAGEPFRHRHFSFSKLVSTNVH